MHRKSLAVVAGVLSLFFASRAPAQAGDVAVIVNPNNPVSNISLSDLRNAFAGEKRTWPGNSTPFKPFVRAPSSHERAVLLQLLGMSEAEYKRHWTAQIFRGEADSEPMVVSSFGMALEAVRAFSGGICFVEARDIRPGMWLKVIRVDGRMPGDAGYALH